MIGLKKRIPVGAGLGGGSSDAAAALVGLNRLWSLGLDDSALRELGSRLGSDVPFFIGPAMALAEDRGEKLTPLPAGRPRPLLLVNPGIHISAQWAYQHCRVLTKKRVDIKLFCRAFDSADYSSLRQLMVNELELPVISSHPVIGEIKARLLEAGAEVSLMSGSGSTVFGVFRGPDEARKAAGCFGEFWSCTAETIVAE